ncbi:MAG: hypothetical protein JW749_09555 [Sedimentisphaerales bacterium]|nr:hypothetical protein [Sedimentisphaerales bacterium]
MAAERKPPVKSESLRFQTFHSKPQEWFRKRLEGSVLFVCLQRAPIAFTFLKSSCGLGVGVIAAVSFLIGTPKKIDILNSLGVIYTRNPPRRINLKKGESP